MWERRMIQGNQKLDLQIKNIKISKTFEKLFSMFCLFFGFILEFAYQVGKRSNQCSYFLSILRICFAQNEKLEMKSLNISKII